MGTHLADSTISYNNTLDRLHDSRVGSPGGLRYRRWGSWEGMIHKHYICYAWTWRQEGGANMPCHAKQRSRVILRPSVHRPCGYKRADHYLKDRYSPCLYS